MIEGILKIQNYENITIQEKARSNQITRDKRNSEETFKAVGSVKAEGIKRNQDSDVQEAIERVMNAAKFFNRKIQLEIENDLGITVVKVIDGDTKEVIRQIPPEELVQLSRRAKDLKGLLVNKEG
jgi:flagellar protein FlaG